MTDNIPNNTVFTELKLAIPGRAQSSCSYAAVVVHHHPRDAVPIGFEV